MLQRCRLGAASEGPFACPEACLFFEDRVVSTAGWAQDQGQPMANTAWGLAHLPHSATTNPSRNRSGGGQGAGKTKKRGRRR